MVRDPDLRPPAGLFPTFIANKRLNPFRPLGHPTFSTGSPRVFHWVTQGFPQGDPSDTPPENRMPQTGISRLRLIWEYCSKQKANNQWNSEVCSCPNTVLLAHSL